MKKLLLFILLIAGSVTYGQTSFNSGQTVKSDSSRNSSKMLDKIVKKKFYILPNGNFISESKIDSVYKIWGGLSMRREIGKDSIKIYLIPLTSNAQKDLEKEEERKKSELFEKWLNNASIDFTVNGLDNKVHTLSSFKNKIVVLNFWFTTCAPCIKEMPALNQLVESYKNSEDVVFLALSLDQPEQVSSFLANHNFAYLHLPSTKKISSAYGIYAWPTHIIIDQKGTIRFIQVGGDHIEQSLELEIEKLRKNS